MGLAEELIDALARLEGLRVVARTSAFQFRGKGHDLREVGEKIHVKTVLEGSVSKPVTACESMPNSSTPVTGTTCGLSVTTATWTTCLPCRTRLPIPSLRSSR